MIRNMRSVLCLLLALCLLTLTFVACEKKADEANTTNADTNGTAATDTNEGNTNNANDDAGVSRTGAWQNATYVKDTTFGTGAKTLTVVVKADDQSITFTIKTDAETVGAALLEHELIAGEESQYGLYVKTVNGMRADYTLDGYYWAFYKNGEYMMTGVDSTVFADGEQYELVREKG